MSKGKPRQQAIPAPAGRQLSHVKQVDSLYDELQGDQFVSIVDCVPKPNVNVLEDVRRALSDIEAYRQRPCIAYVGNVVRDDKGGSGIHTDDDLPFNEMIRNVDPDTTSVDVFLATRGGSAQQVARFVDALRQRFESVEFLIPSFCMSAGTLFALSGDRIWMTPSAALGPIDPQVPSPSSGRYVPAQALLTLVEQTRASIQESIRKTNTVDWVDAQIINTIDKRELGEAITATAYGKNMASQFLERYKFKEWKVRETSNEPVTGEYRKRRADEVATELAKHERWNSHGHSISREVLWSEIRLKVDEPDPELLRLMRRAWALYNWLFEKSTVVKLLLSANYKFARNETLPPGVK